MRPSKGSGKIGQGEVYVLDPSALEIGDIVLSTDPTDTVSRLIRLTTGGNYSHAAICTRVGLLMEATTTKDWEGGVRRSSIMRIVAGDPASLRILRLRQEIPNRDAIAKKAAATAEWMLDRFYWSTGVFWFLPYKYLTNKIPANERQGFFCSHLVAEGYKRAELELLPGVRPEQTTPVAFIRSDKLEDVTDKVLRVENEELARANAPSDDESPHTEIEQAINQEILSDPAVHQIVARYGEKPPAGYWDLLTILARTKDPQLDKIVAAGVDRVASGYGQAFKRYGFTKDQLRHVEEALKAGEPSLAAIEDQLRVLERSRTILKQDVQDREKDVKQNRVVARRTRSLKTFVKRLSFSKEYLTFMRGQLMLLQRHIKVLESARSAALLREQINGEEGEREN